MVWEMSVTTQLSEREYERFKRIHEEDDMAEKVSIINGKTEELSPKTIAAALSPAIPGLVLLVLGIVLGDDTLRVAGITALAGGGVAGTAAYKAKTGTVTGTKKAPVQ